MNSLGNILRANPGLIATLALLTGTQANHLPFGRPLRRLPKRGDREWCQRVDSAWDAGKPGPSPEKKFNLRYKVQLVEPSPPAPDPTTVRTQEFAGLKPDALLEDWLPFLFEEPTHPCRKFSISPPCARGARRWTRLRSTPASFSTH
jgi:hypothetical protein